MKNTGVERKIDELGRIVLPKSMRNRLDIKENDLLEISTDGESIILRKKQSACVFCNSTEETVLFGEKLICKVCLEKLKAEL